MQKLNTVKLFVEDLFTNIYKLQTTKSAKNNFKTSIDFILRAINIQFLNNVSSNSPVSITLLTTTSNFITLKETISINGSNTNALYYKFDGNSYNFFTDSAICS